MDEAIRRAELARFLRSRRDAITPETFGIPKGPRRRTPGLRREEIAARANIGLTWYTWLEQGRDIQVSREVVGRIAAAMCLSPSDQAYLASLTNQPISTKELPPDDAIREAQAVLDGFIAGPAMLWNSHFDCIAFNRLAHALYDWSDSPEPLARNMLWRAFMDPKRQQMYSGTESSLHNAIGLLRSRYASHLGDPYFESLVKVMLEGSEQFRRLWTENHTASLAPAIFVLAHPKYGKLIVRSVRAIFPPIPEGVLAFLCPADETTKKIFENLNKELDQAH